MDSIHWIQICVKKYENNIIIKHMLKCEMIKLET